MRTDDVQTLRHPKPQPLAEEFAEIVPTWLVQAEVRRAESDLRGQVPGGSLPELVHRLARERLRQRLHAGA
ncbi:hypothetical protein ACL02T_24800 [Pseudonocardia sp. RS010]|uniref:hypothetical protein n=1 Tax=Pseudonocardia sp. RS010 TaxID=3385979 RepID=UPI00399F5BB2